MKDTTGFIQEYFKNVSDFYRNFDFASAMPNAQSSVKSNQKNMHLMFDLVHLMNEKSQMILKKQMEIFQDNLEEVFHAIKELGECPLEAKDVLDKHGEFAHKNATRNMQHATELGALYTQATSEIFRKYSEQVQNGMSEIKKSSNKEAEAKAQKKS